MSSIGSKLSVLLQSELYVQYFYHAIKKQTKKTRYGEVAHEQRKSLAEEANTEVRNTWSHSCLLWKRGITSQKHYLKLSRVDISKYCISLILTAPYQTYVWPEEHYPIVSIPGKRELAWSLLNVHWKCVFASSVCSLFHRRGRPIHSSFNEFQWFVFMGMFDVYWDYYTVYCKCEFKLQFSVKRDFQWSPLKQLSRNHSNPYDLSLFCNIWNQCQFKQRPV